MEASVILPLIYPQTAEINEILTTNGVGFLNQCTKCVVTKELNGQYEIDVDTQSTDRLAGEIFPQGYIKAKPNNVENPQIFQIYETNFTNRKLQIKGEHIRYRLSGDVLTEPGAFTGTPSTIWSNLQDYLVYTDHGFNFSSDISTSNTVTAGANSPISLGEFLIGSQGSMLDAFGGKFDFDNFDVTFNSNVGVVTGVCLRLGAGIEDINYDVSCQYQYSHIMPVANVADSNGGTWFIVFPPNYSPSIPIEITGSTLNRKRVLLYDFTDIFNQRYPAFVCNTTELTSRNEACLKLITLCTEYISVNADVLKYPKINVKLKAGAERLKGCKVGDTIQVCHEGLGLSFASKIIKTTYDVLGERYISIELGQPLKRLSRYFSNKNIGGV